MHRCVKAKNRRQAHLLVAVSLLLSACGGEPAATGPATPAAPAGEGTPAARAVARIIPEAPSSSDCLQLLVTGQPASPRVVWLVNGQPVAVPESGRLCSDQFRRGDQVSVTVGGEGGASAAVIIANSPPRVTGLSATPAQVFGDSDVVVTPAGEDKDGDPVQFRYQWLINGQANPFLTDNKLANDQFNKGDVIQVRITPYDGRDEGPVYESYRMTIPNAPPRIESNPPPQFEALEYRYQVAAADVDGDSLNWRLDKAPQGMTIDPASGLIIWPLAGFAAGAYPVRIVVRDPDGGEAFQEYTLTLGAPK